MAKILFLSIILIFHQYRLLAQDRLSIVPRPDKVTLGTGEFTLSKSTRIFISDTALSNSASFLKNYISQYYGIDVSVDTNNENRSGSEILLLLNRATNGNAYKLDVTNKNIGIRAATDTGVFYGVQTLIQLLPLNERTADPKTFLQLPEVKIEDSPRFGYRGIHLDVARHFFDTAYIKKFIDLLALHKFNVFHWHLTDDQGWRAEVKKFPLLTATGSCRSQTLLGRFGSGKYDSLPHCGYYSVEQMKDIVSFAASRYITIIPEIDVPGHTTAALASYPFLGCRKGPYEVSQTWGVHKEVMCAGNDSTYQFIEEVLREVTGIFPSQLIHMGGDEVPKDRWKACPVCQARIRSEGLKDEAELQSYFIGRVNKIVKAFGRTMIGWDEILDGNDVPGTVIMNWRGKKFSDRAFRLGHPVIFSPDRPMYLNFQQSMHEDSVTQGGNNQLEDVYSYEPQVHTSSPSLTLGIQANLWTEYISNAAKLEYMALPRLSAVAEAAWSDPARKNFSDFERRLPEIIKRYKRWGFNYSSAHLGLQHETVSRGSGGINWKLFSRTKGRIYFGFSEPAIDQIYSGEIPVLKSKTLYARLCDSSGNQIGGKVAMHFDINRATGKKITLQSLPNAMYSGDGGFTLVDGVQNSQGMVRSAQFLGFIGNDLDAIIDLGSMQDIRSIRLHAFEQKESWIYSPRQVLVFVSEDGKIYEDVTKVQKRGIKDIVYEVFLNARVRFVRIVARNHGIIGEGNEGAGRRAWLFVDEIEVE